MRQAPSCPRRQVRRQVRLTVEQVDQLEAARLGGAQITELAERFGIHPATVLQHLKRRGVPHRRRQWRSLSAEQIQEAGQLYGSGLPLLAVADRFGVDRRYLRTVLPEAGFPLRRPGRQRWDHDG